MNTPDEAREAVKRARQAISEPYPSTDAGLEHLVAAVEALVSAATPAIETSEVGKRHFFEQPGDENYAEFVAKAGAEIDAEIIADLEQRLAEKERRIGELEEALRAALSTTGRGSE